MTDVFSLRHFVSESDIASVDLRLIAEVPITGSDPGLLYVGSIGERDARDYTDIVDDVVLVHEPRLPWERTRDVRVALFPFADGPGHLRDEDRKHIDLAVSYVETALRAARRVAVVCRMGRNRSALVAALTFRRLWPTVPPRPVIAFLRSKRGPACLSNAQFVRLIEATESGVRPKF
jgi:hypothetical protein